jgi:hypothetical protein
MKKAIALSLVLIFTVVAYGCQGGCGPQPANNTTNNANTTKTATPAATPAMTPATTNTTSTQFQLEREQGQHEPDQTP